MTLRKLIPMTDYVNQILAYVHESHNYERGIKLIQWYSELIAQPIQMDMFTAKNSLFPNFKFVDSQKQALDENLLQSIHNFGKNGFAVTLYRKSEHSNAKSGMCFITSYHLKTINDLCNKDIDFNIESDYAESSLFD